MRIITGNRGSGLSTSLVLESAQFNTPILTFSTSSCSHLKNIAKQLKITIPEPINLNNPDPSLHDMFRNHDRILIDNADRVLEELLRQKGFYGTITAVGISLDGIGLYGNLIEN